MARATFLDGRPFGSGGVLLGLDAFRTDGHRSNSGAEAMELFSKFGFGDVETGRTVVTLGLRDSHAGWPGPEPAPDPLDRSATQLAFGNDEVSSLVDIGNSVSGYVQADYRRGEFRARLSVDRQEEDPHQERMKWDSGDASYHHIVQEDSYDTTKPELEASMKWELSPTIKVSTGGGLAYDCFEVDTSERDLDAASATTGYRMDERTTASVWGQAEFDQDPWQGIVGVRWDEPSDYDGKASGRLLGAWKNETGLRLEAGIGSAFRAPSLNDLNWPASVYAEGNPDLKPESAWEGDLAVKWAPGGRERTRLTATIFHKEVDDFIMWCPDTSGIWRPENLNHVEIRGLELAGRLPIGAGLQARLAYTLLGAMESGPRLTHVDYAAPDPYTFTETERDLAYAPDHQVNLGIEWSKETGSGKAKVGLSVSWVSDIRQYYEDWITISATEYDVEYPHKELEAHWLFGLRAAWSWSERNEVSIKIENLLDEEYATQFGYALQDGDYPMPGRTVTVGARFNF
jgi:outer membrane cobalamin receptor